MWFLNLIGICFSIILITFTLYIIVAVIDTAINQIRGGKKWN